MNFHHDLHFETTEARLLREAHNKKASKPMNGTASGSDSHQETREPPKTQQLSHTSTSTDDATSDEKAKNVVWLLMPTTAGTALVKMEADSASTEQAPEQSTKKSCRIRKATRVVLSLGAGAERAVSAILDFLHGRDADWKSSRTHSALSVAAGGMGAVTAQDASIMLSRVTRTRMMHLEEDVPPLTAEAARAKATYAARKAELSWMRRNEMKVLQQTLPPRSSAVSVRLSTGLSA
eukprot:2445590-Prymnesium_polylepis.1